MEKYGSYQTKSAFGASDDGKQIYKNNDGTNRYNDGSTTLR